VTLRRAYLRSAYEVAGVRFRIGRRCAALDALLARLATRRAALLGAWNPRSRRMPAGWNRRAAARLRAAARRLAFAEGWGGTASWREEHLLVAGDPRRLLPLARRFRQRAIVLIEHGRRPRLIWVLGGNGHVR
jgi:Protein of unknown function (DUF3293)